MWPNAVAPGDLEDALVSHWEKESNRVHLHLGTGASCPWPSESVFLLWRLPGGHFLECLFGLCFVFGLGLVTVFETMGQAASTLTLTLALWKEVKSRAHNLSVKVRQGK